MKDFKDKHKGKTFVIFGSGPSLLDWDDSFCGDVIKVGCNTVFMHKPNLDYYLIQDSGLMTGSKNGYCKFKNKYDKYQPSIKKFYGVSYFDKGRLHGHSLSPQDVKDGEALTYSVGSVGSDSDFIEFYSVIFSCLQFADLCGAEKIIVVGCDVTNNIRVGEEQEHNGYKITNLKKRWENFKNFYPHLNIKVFKPMGLKDLFKEYKIS
jgi:hypothetical protein